jgi:hypothetical protein
VKSDHRSAALSPTHRRRNALAPTLGLDQSVFILGSCFARRGAERFCTTRIDRYGCVATRRSRCAIRQGALFGTQAQRAPLLSCRFAIASRSRRTGIARPNTNCIGYILTSVRAARCVLSPILPRCIPETRSRNLSTLSSFYLSRALDGQGMVHESQLNVLHLTVRSGDCRISAGEQPTGPTIVCECSNMFACCPI